MTYHPNNTLVTIGWLKKIAGLPTNQINTTLARDNTSWAASGFVQVGPCIGGTPDLYLPVNEPVMQVDFWACNPGSEKPPWGKAEQLAQIVKMFCWEHGNVPQLIDSFPGYAKAQVMSAWCLIEPRKIQHDQGAYARFQLDLALRWVEVPS